MSMPEHVHVHAPHELSESSEAVSSRERILEIIAAVMLSLATVAIAWSGYQAARWSGLQARLYTEASTARSLANRDAVKGSQERLQDLLNFNRWLEVSTQGNTQLADLYQRRFRDEFRPAFDAWIAQDPLNNRSAVASPLLMPQYVIKDEVQSSRLEAVGDRRFAEGRDATENADDYIFLTVLFAVVLFFAGISLRFAWPILRLIVLGIGAVILVYGLVELSLMNTY
jgi:hypothetical protein